MFHLIPVFFFCLTLLLGLISFSRWHLVCVNKNNSFLGGVCASAEGERRDVVWWQQQQSQVW